jgi:selenide,water dikinase
MRPLGKLVERLDRLLVDWKKTAETRRLVVVGGGASGCELSLALAKRFAPLPHVAVCLVSAADRVLPDFPPKASEMFLSVLNSRKIQLRLNARVLGGDERNLLLENGERLPFDVVLWATNAAPNPLLATTDLPTDAGFLRVRETLQSVGDDAIFGTGDCVHFDAFPILAKNGVYAVRQGGVLFDNVCRFLRDKKLTVFKPQRSCMYLLNGADGTALMSWGNWVSRGMLLRILKDRIDRDWVRKFTQFPKMRPTARDKEDPTMRCGGCGNKISADVLSAVLKRLDPGDDPRVLLGAKASEDGAVHRMRPELFGSDPEKLVEVQTVDYFKTFLDDPFLFGKIAALGALSDLFAMNARPFSALAIATLPLARGPIQEGLLYEMLSGAICILKENGVILTGGHTTEGAELALGFAVTGHAEEDRLFQKGQLKAGDVLILTKPLGTGAILAAWMRGECRAEWYHKVIAGMLLSNRRAGQILAAEGIRACTDVTGFGFAGHLFEMLDASAASAEVRSGKVALYPGFEEVVDGGIVSSLHRDNAKIACRIQGANHAWLYDPQTSGGLLAGVPQDKAEKIVTALIDAGYSGTRAIGRVVEKKDDVTLNVQG